MWGKSERQVNRLFNETMNGIGESRHNDKQLSRELGAESFRDVAKLTSIYSHGTADTYLPYWKNLVDFSNKNKGIKDVEKITNRAVKEFLQLKIREVNCNSTFRKISSAILKMEESLNRYSIQNDTNNRYNWQKIVDNARVVSRSKLAKSIVGRGFEDCKDIINHLPKSNEDHILVSKIQMEAGIRVYEACLIKSSQLKGIGKDPYSSKEAGVLLIKGKGGKMREVYLSPSTYKELEKRVEDKELKVGITSYTKAIKHAAYRSGQSYTGTHDFRHSWVQNRYKEVSGLGYSDSQILASISEEIGHVRPDITEIYLR